MRAAVAVLYGVLSLVAYVAITSGVFIAKGLDWFLYYYLIPVATFLVFFAILNVIRTKDTEVMFAKFFRFIVRRYEVD